jgi:hypothetical protein
MTGHRRALSSRKHRQSQLIPQRDKRAGGAGAGEEHVHTCAGECAMTIITPDEPVNGDAALRGALQRNPEA